MFFLVLSPLPHHYALLSQPPRHSPPPFNSWELVGTFHELEGAWAFCRRHHITPIECFHTKVKRRVSDETREKLRLTKLGPLNPNSKGLGAEHKRKIGLANKGKYRGAENINHGRPRTPRDRMKISQGKYLEAQRVKRHWVLSPSGVERLLPTSLPVPDGWVKGRKRSNFMLKRPTRRRKKYPTRPSAAPPTPPFL
jgi:hypothetical protein